MSEELDLLILSVKNGQDEFTEYFKRQVQARMSEHQPPVTVAAPVAPAATAEIDMGTNWDRQASIVEKAPKSAAEAFRSSETPRVRTGTFSPVVDDPAQYKTISRRSLPGFTPQLRISGDNLIEDCLHHSALRNIDTDTLLLALSVPEPTKEVMKIRQAIIDNLQYPKQMLAGLLFAVCGLSEEEITKRLDLKFSAVSSYLSTTRKSADLMTLTKRRLSTSPEHDHRSIVGRDTGAALNGQLLPKEIALANKWRRAPEHMRKTGPNSFVISQIVESAPFKMLHDMWPLISAKKIEGGIRQRFRPRVTNNQFAMAVMYRAHGFSMTDYRSMHTKMLNKFPDLFISVRQMENLFSIYDCAMWNGIRNMINEHQLYITYPGFALLVDRAEDYQG
jgi:hypothetical protein